MDLRTLLGLFLLLLLLLLLMAALNNFLKIGHNGRKQTNIMACKRLNIAVWSKAIRTQFCLSHQISMSVLRIPIRVTRTLIAPILTVLTAVLANKDLMEMESLVKVLKCENVRNYLLELSPCDEN